MNKIDRSLFRAAFFVRFLVRLFPSVSVMLKLGVFGGLAAVLRGYFAFEWHTVGAAVAVAYLATGGWRFAKVIVRTLPRDLRGLIALVRLRLTLMKRQRNRELVHNVFEARAKRHPNKIAFRFEDQSWTFNDVNNFANAIANYFFEKGLQKGDTVAIFMESRPEFACYWLGLSKIGVIGALINFNLRAESLEHCINVAGPKAVIYGAELTDAIRDIRPKIGRDVAFYSTGGYQDAGFAAVNLDPELKKTSTLPAPVILGRKFTDKLFYIYTSGTTGLPKAAIITQIRFMYMGYGIRYGFHCRFDDVIYNTLPLYHSAGGIVGMAQVILNGSTMAIRKKFSASRFWDDCIKYEATIVQYIGEICRYVLAQPAKPVDTQHKVRMAIGNGFRPQIWEEFQSRYNIKEVAEFYGATEGNSNIVNIDGKVGAVGFISLLVPSALPIVLLKVDEGTGDLIRGPDGLCIKCKPGETGHLIGKIKAGDPIAGFDGYVNRQATSKKIAYDVSRKGDQAFLSGDILQMDEDGYLFFKDRSGDTFRWRGENVSTSEVEGIIQKHIQLNDAVVYGVEVPGLEGRAGMVAIVDSNGTLNLAALNESLKKSLPAYARPIFIRIMQELDTTGTFKLKKVELRKESFNPKLVKGDKLFFMNGKEFVPLTESVFSDIVAGKIRI
ncbi:long-chain fatty acid transport protein 4-like [Asterias rubens]|uniref:long-chain fatty acid transport protein 4-like n=1 Tax=Asterias rubens TaxID=7604 RepID=UPI0014552743|nr:long-chain fatty acid transport protein 4-like [Asterias rubens]